MSTITLEKPMTEGGIRTINFFNGRMLSGEDLTQEQSANRAARLQLGQTVGEGIAYGLEVSETPRVSTKTSPVVTVTAGLAINRAGQTLALAADTDVSLVRPLDGAASSSTTAVFAECKPPQSGVYIAGAGVYLLTVVPAAAGEGRAPVSGLGNTTAACNTRYTVEGVQFRLLQLDLTLTELDDTLHLRNLVAYKCFGVEGIKNFSRDPFAPVGERYRLLDTLRPNRLTDCEVPLAILHWTTTEGIKFIDMWAVRRRLVALSANEQGLPAPLLSGDARRWLPLVDQRIVNETEAMFLQFEDQIQDIRANEAAIGALVVTQRFRYLPPIGILPVTGQSSPTGFVPEVFFDRFASKDVALIDGNLLRNLMHEARYHEAIDLDTANKVQLYLIWENVQAVQQRQTSQLALVFASPALSYRGVTRFHYANWGLSRFAPTVL